MHFPTPKFILLLTAQCLVTIVSAGTGSTRNVQGSRTNFQFPIICTFMPNLPFCSTDLDECPVVEPLGDEFDMDKYTAKSWYVQKQQTNPYQGSDNLYCVVATYKIRDDGNVQVYNYSNKGAVNEKETDAKSSSDKYTGLCGNPIEGGKLQVTPCPFIYLGSFITDLTAGPYWVVAVDDTAAEEYQWAVVTGGAPDKIKSEDPLQCTTSDGGNYIDAIQGSGLWIFSRDQIADATTMASIMTKLDELGIYAGDLEDVTQEGCNYTNAFIKD